MSGYARNVTYTHNKILFNLKWNEMLTHAATWMKLQAAVLSEVSQDQGHRVRVHLYEVFAADSLQEDSLVWCSGL